MQQIQNDILKELQERKESYIEASGILEKNLIAHVRRQMFSCNDGTAMSKLPASRKRQLDIKAFRFIVTEVFCLTPEKLDSIWSMKTLCRMNLSSLARNIAGSAPDEVKEATLFNRQKIVLHECFPDYYKYTYPATYDVFEVINASYTALRDLAKAGKIKLPTNILESGKDKAAGTGKIVDKIAYNALNVFLNEILETKDIKEHMTALARPERFKIKSLGISKVIVGRGCWKSLLDFYFAQLTWQEQTECFNFYQKLRMESQEYDSLSVFLDAVNQEVTK